MHAFYVTSMISHYTGSHCFFHVDFFFKDSQTEKEMEETDWKTEKPRETKISKLW